MGVKFYDKNLNEIKFSKSFYDSIERMQIHSDYNHFDKHDKWLNITLKIRFRLYVFHRLGGMIFFKFKLNRIKLISCKSIILFLDKPNNYIGETYKDVILHVDRNIANYGTYLLFNITKIENKNVKIREKKIEQILK